MLPNDLTYYNPNDLTYYRNLVSWVSIDQWDFRASVILDTNGSYVYADNTMDVRDLPLNWMMDSVRT